MSGNLPVTTIQKARRFLSALDVQTSSFADSSEVIALLIAKVKSHRDDPGVRDQLQGLMTDLRDEPDWDVETIEGAALADHLALLLDENPGAMPFAHQRTIALLAALSMLLIGVAFNGGCFSGDGSEEDSVSVCASDVSPDHFSELIDRSDELTEEEYQNAEDAYDQLPAAKQADVIMDLCKMSAEDIAYYIESGFEDTGGDPYDGEAIYKGVSF